MRQSVEKQINLPGQKYIVAGSHLTKYLESEF